MSRWVWLRAIGFGALTYFLLRYTADGQWNVYDIIPAVILIGISIQELIIINRKNRMPPK